MELMPGYKQTEAGVIPEDWNATELGAISSVTAGGTPSRRIREYWDGEVPWVTTTEIDFNTITQTAQCISPIGMKNSAAKLLAPGTLLLALYGQGKTRGKVAVLGVEATTNQACASIKLSSNVDVRYVFHFLSSRYAEIRSLSNSGSQDNLNGKIVKSLQIALPPTTVEQESIAAALDDADALIESLEQLLGKKRQIKQGAMQELLTGKKRIPGFSELWTETNIGDAVERIVGGGTPSRMVPGYWGGDVPWMTVKDFAHHDTRGTIEYITREGLKRSASNLIPKGTLITSTRMALGKAVVFEVDVSINQDLKALFPKPSTDTRFLYYWFEANQQGIAEIGSGSTVMGISLGELRKIPFVKPPSREQQAIASVLTEMDAELETIERKLTKACQLKQGMMQELLTGKIRLGRPSADVMSFPTKKSSSVADVSHNTHFNEAVVIAVLSAKFGSETFPLGRFRRTKFSYLLHRHVEHEAAGFMKKAAGPYNPQTRYGGAEKIALQNRYVRVLSTGKSEGFVADENIAQAEGYFDKWYGVEALTWLEQFRYQKNDALELLTTVDMACEDLSRAGKAATLSAVKQVIHESPEWKAKLNRAVFSDDNIATTIQSCGQLFPIERNNDE